MLTIFAALLCLQTPSSATLDLTAAKRLWLDMGMPTLTSWSRPVLIPTGSWPGSGRSEYLAIGFTNPANAPTGSIVVGTDIYSVVKPRSGDRVAVMPRTLPADWSSTTIKRLDKGIFVSAGFHENAMLSAAIMADLLGRESFADKILARVQLRNVNTGLGTSTFGIPKKEDLVSYAALEIAAHLANQLLHPETDRRTILAGLRKLDAMNLLAPGYGSQGLGQIARDLELTLTRSSAASDRVELAFLDLTDSTGIEIWGRSGTPDPRYERVRKLGLAVVPTLVSHLEDRRLTRSFFPGIDNAGPSIISLGSAAVELLRDISKGKLGQDGAPINKVTVMKWFRSNAGKG